MSKTLNNFSNTNIFQNKDEKEESEVELELKKENTSFINEKQFFSLIPGKFDDLKTCHLVIKEQKAVIKACMAEIEALKKNKEKVFKRKKLNTSKIDRALELVKKLKKFKGDTEEMHKLKLQNMRYKNIIELLVEKYKDTEIFKDL
ncbi:hypothetical protein EHP00_1554 [Ecytonucleospora hepatopenaei]|uniref:Uncharacterized protein n=1 Tax=Ecytonucleospora hepatopenaei TaxID=646526 RepID=A0A1W0E7F7_9MICR|nr:hypothetical protein EHP00_1554 [Ecytonucleospora hepatopenaei]